MAGLRQTGSGTYNITFRYGTKQFCRSLETSDPGEAKRKKAIVEETLKHLRAGILSLPNSIAADELWQFLRSGGKVSSLPELVPSITLDSICLLYLKSYGEHAKERTTLDTEEYHCNHFRRIVGKRTLLSSIGSTEIREYICAREKEQGTHGRTVRPVTISKELQTFRLLWSFAKSGGYVTGDNPIDEVKKPRGSDPLPFMAWEEITKRVRRGELTEGEIAELWECLFLRENEIAHFLQQVAERGSSLDRFPYIYAAVAFCAYTGARRSEMFRCRIDDVNGSVLLREKKKAQDRRFTFREVPLHPELQPILDQWLSQHPGGQYMFCKNNRNPLDDKTSREAFRAVKKQSKWRVLRGYHVLRHSFCSNLARHGVDQYKIDQFMGHQTEAMRRRYRHLFPEDRESAINVLSFQSSR